MNRRSFLQTLGLAVAAPVLELACEKCGWGNPTNASYCGGCGACTRCERTNGESGIIDFNMPSQLRLRDFRGRLISSRAILTQFTANVCPPAPELLGHAAFDLRFVSTGPVTVEKV